MNIYIANIPFKASDAELKELFEQHGEVTSAKIVIDKMTDSTAAKEAINALNGADFQGKALVVNESRPKSDSSGGGYSTKGGNKRW